MRFYLSILLFLTIIICSVFIGLITSMLRIEQPNFLSNQHDQTIIKKNLNHEKNLLDVIGNQTENLLWFMQISDLHISIFHDPKRVEHFINFCNTTVDVINPSVVLASGDLTDSKKSNHLDSQQFREEWQLYFNALQNAKIQQKTVWLDIRGNHDNFNVPEIGKDSKFDFFTNYSMQGRLHKKSYAYNLEKGGNKYSFIGIDASLNPGPKRPFNFIGILSTNETQHVVDLAQKAQKWGTDHIIWFAHYPTSCIVGKGFGSAGVRDLLSKFSEGIVYLCGHFHTMGGLIPNMYTLQNGQLLELELADWMRHRFYRIAAIDNGLFSFVDVQHNDWPVILITNPKNALFNNPAKEMISLQKDSTHIRILAFSLVSIVDCKVRINQEDWRECQQIDKKLFVAEWWPKKYKHGLHRLHVKVTDADGRTKVVEQKFSLDGSRLDFDLLARFVLMIDMNAFYQGLFGVALLMCVLPLCFCRVWHVLVVRGVCRKLRGLTRGCGWGYLRKMWILSTVDRVAIPVVLYSFYLVFGPWSFCEVIDGYFSVIFVWGIFVKEDFLPGTLTYLYGALQLMLCQFPLILVYANSVDRRLKTINQPQQQVTTNKKSILVKVCFHSPFIFIIVVEILLALVFWNAYGVLAFLLAPMRTWSVVLSIYLWYSCENLGAIHLRSAAIVWTPETKTAE